MSTQTEQMSQQQMQDFFTTMISKMNEQSTNVDPFGAMKSMQQVAEAWVKNPQELTESMNDWSKRIGEVNMKVWNEFVTKSRESMEKGEFGKVPKVEEMPYFGWIQEYYKLYADFLQESIKRTPDVPDRVKDKARFWTEQMVSAIAPNNYFWTNPGAIREFMDTEGKSLMKGFENWVKDLKEQMPQMVDKTPFEVGKNLANSPGKVVYRNELMELIQYQATTDQAHQVPILITPPWINKFYILDLNEKNSFVRNLVNNGFTVFMISWKNPTAEMRETGLEDYMTKGPIEASNVVKEITGAPSVHVVGYCIGGSMLATTMGWLNADENKSKNNFSSFTLLTTLVDFEQPGDLGLFVDEDSLKFVEKTMAEHGFLDGKQMGTTYRMLKADGLIWNYVVNNYLYGKTPPPIDMLFWNEDSTRLPEKAHSYYLREYYINNNLCKGKVELLGTKVDLKKITQPLYSVSAEKDHITPWKQVFKTGLNTSGPVRFALSTSGHIAGVVNPPLNPPKRAYWAGPVDQKKDTDPAAWQQSIKQVPGTWWEDWTQWLKTQCGEMAALPPIGSRKHKVLGDAPGTYVVEK
jgi:polyhydroxyalkanoate synthase